MQYKKQQQKTKPKKPKKQNKTKNVLINIVGKMNASVVS